MTNFLEIAEQCEKATGPDRRLDGLIFKATAERPGDVWTLDAGGYEVWMRQDPEDHCAYDTPLPYTESLDAAMTLVPGGLDWRVDTMTGLPGAIVCVPNAWLSYKTAPRMVRGNSPALALAAAALRAKASAVTSNERKG